MFQDWLVRRMMCPTEPPDYPTITYTFTQASDGTVELYYPNSPAGVASVKVDGVPVSSKNVSVTAGEHTVEIVIPSGVMPTRMFLNRSMITAMVLTGPWTVFNEESFRGVNNMVHCTLSLPDLTTLNERYTFLECRNMVGEVDLPSLTTISGYGHFQSCEKITKVLSLGSTTKISDHMFYKCSGLTDVTLPSTLTEFSGEEHFRDCSSLTNCTLYLPNLTTIGGRYTFNLCTSLIGEVNFPSLASISGYSHFYGTKITKVLSLGSITTIPDSMFYNCSELTDVVLPTTTTTIQNEAFRNCNKLKNVNFSSLQNLTTIGETVFYANFNLIGELNFPALTTLGYRSFNSTSITKVINLGSITYVDAVTFYNCNSLTEVTLPSTLTSIGSEAFRGCSALSWVKILATTPPTVNSNSFNYTPASLKIYVPNGYGATYQADSNWSTYASKIYELDANGNIPT